MATVEKNRDRWDRTYDWSRGGDEWSVDWGGPDLQWWGSIFPRVRSFLPAETVLEIGPGFGRWTRFLLGHCERLSLVDLSERCMEACKQRFSASHHLTYYVNDGRSLGMIPNHSVDFVFSFDSLVHAEADVLQSYLHQLSQKLKPNGVGWIHHSNLGAYPRACALARKVPMWFRPRLMKSGLLVNLLHWRSESMSAELFVQFCQEAGLQCIAQEKISLEMGSYLIDCFSLFTPRGSAWARPNRVVQNPSFKQEAICMSRLAQLYSPRADGSSQASERP